MMVIMVTGVILYKSHKVLYPVNNVILSFQGTGILYFIYVDRLKTFIYNFAITHELVIIQNFQ